MDLFFDQEFHALIPPLSQEECIGLADSLKREGNRDPITIWKETKLLLDGHNRYDICTHNGIELKPALELSFPNRTAAMIWIIRNQFDRRNLQPYSRGVLALKLELLLKPVARENQGTRTDLGKALPNIVPTLAPSSQDRKVREQVAKAAHVSHGTLDKVKSIEAKATPKQKAKLVAGSATINQIYTSI